MTELSLSVLVYRPSSATKLPSRIRGLGGLRARDCYPWRVWRLRENDFILRIPSDIVFPGAF